MQVPAAWKTLQVQHCSSGQITEDSNRTCRVCGNSTFSMNPLKQSCDPCPSGADCHGADVFIPPKHSWHSSPNSTTIVSCPNADACEGNRTTLLRCKKVSPLDSSPLQLAAVQWLATSSSVARARTVYQTNTMWPAGIAKRGRFEKTLVCITCAECM